MGGIWLKKMISPEVYDKQMKDRASGKLGYMKTKRAKFYNLFKERVELMLKIGSLDRIIMGWEDDLPCSNWDEYRHCLFPAVQDLRQELQDLGYYVDIKECGFIHVIYMTIRTKPNLWERLFKKV